MTRYSPSCTSGPGTRSGSRATAGPVSGPPRRTAAPALFARPAAGTPVGPVQRTRLDQSEVGHQRAQLGDMLDPPDQVAVGRVVLADDGRTGLLAVRDQNVDLVAMKRLAGADCQTGDVGGFLLLAKVVRMLDHVLLHHVKVGLY